MQANLRHTIYSEENKKKQNYEHFLEP